MKNKIIALLLLIPILLTLVVFVSYNNLFIPVDVSPSRLILEHEEIEATPFNDNNAYPLYAYTIPRNIDSTIIWESSNPDVIEIKDNVAYSKKEGEAIITCKVKNTSLEDSFVLYSYDNNATSISRIIVTDSTKNNLFSNNDFVYGEYDLINNQKVKAKNKLNVKALPLKYNDELKYEIIEGDCEIDKDFNITFKDSNDLKIKFYNDQNDVSTIYEFDIIKDGINIYSYEDLMNVTNKNKDGEIAVLRVNLESRENAFKNLTNNDREEDLFKNTKVFGYQKDKNEYEHDVIEIESTYDTTFIKNLNKDENSNLSTKVKVGIDLKKDLYGNGFTINMHELTFPKSKISGTNKPTLTSKNLYRGPLEFVKVGVDAMSISVFGQDNIGLLVNNDDVTIQDLNLKSCNEVNDLTHLDYVGTTLEIMGDNVIIKDSLLSNGTNVVRSFSNKNLLIDNCLIQNSREFNLKVGSNSFIKPAQGIDLTTLTDQERKELLNPEPIDLECLNSNLVINDTYLAQSGFFSIGVDTHFSGEVLYGGSEYNLGGLYDLAGTSEPTKIEIKGDTRFYDWKKLSSLDSSSLIKPSSAAEEILGKLFDIQAIIKAYLDGAGKNKELAYYEDEDIYVHGGIAFYGGGKNYSKLILEDALNEDFSSIDEIYIEGLPSLASGPYPFRFKLYSTKTNPNYFKEKVNINELFA